MEENAKALATILAPHLSGQVHLHESDRSNVDKEPTLCSNNMIFKNFGFDHTKFSP